ncbi:hypothetical protein AQUCO_00700769v1 [Aquilegia coerulea]|uniref:Sialate O-acetylesterase domain-containing protein n=1 Tax=Aquilegia coerulea TaxID=218851 RepID=A0A2G5ELI8_AQUCA|nr:hypothetical protein AQUCO_00700769v1 [Aquilegia coerulea]
MLLLLLIFLLVFYSDLARSSQLRSEFKHKNIFILAGQSNMAGRGGVIDEKWDGIIPSECQSNSLVLRLNARTNWEEAREPLHADIDVTKACGIGPGMAFANSVREIEPRIGTIGLVPCAIGGTNISEWHRGMSLYNNLVNRAKAALIQGGTIRAILWYQGESDTISQADAESYGLNLKNFMLDLRADLQSPMLPIIQIWEVGVSSQSIRAVDPDHALEIGVLHNSRLNGLHWHLDKEHS